MGCLYSLVGGSPRTSSPAPSGDSEPSLPPFLFFYLRPFPGRHHDLPRPLPYPQPTKSHPTRPGCGLFELETPSFMGQTWEQRGWELGDFTTSSTGEIFSSQFLPWLGQLKRQRYAGDSCPGTVGLRDSSSMTHAQAGDTAAGQVSRAGL